MILRIENIIYAAFLFLAFLCLFVWLGKGILTTFILWCGLLIIELQSLSTKTSYELCDPLTDFMFTIQQEL